MTEAVTTETITGAMAPDNAGEATTPAPAASTEKVEATPVETADAATAEQSPTAAAEENSTEPSPTEISIETPEGMDAFKADFEAYNEAVNQWLKENPDAKATDALKWVAERQASLVAEQTEEAMKGAQAQIEKWEGEAKADPELGKDWDKTISRARLAMDKYGSDGLREGLNASGLGSHPEFIRFVARAGAALEEAPVVPPAGEGARRPLANRIYSDS